MFPQAAAANPSIFYDGAGRPRSAGDVYAKLASRFEVARADSFAPDLTLPNRHRAGCAPASARSPSPDTAGVTQAFAQANDDLPPLPDTKPLFQAMFTDRARKAVTQTVSSLWAPTKNEAPAEPARPLDLFTDTPTDTRKLFRGSAS